jgi:parvulin-like peptidyl-prolyl isomerase
MDGEILGPIKSASGKHIVYVTQRRPERYRASHILKALPKRAKRAQKKQALAEITKLHEELLANQRTANSLFVRLAKKYSDDPTRDRGGDLGAFYLGGEPKFSKEFEEAVFKTSTAKTSAPVRSPFGWHIYFIHDRKETRVQSFDEVKAEIKEQLKDKRLRRSKSNLIKKLRSEGAIERYIEL